MCARYRLVRNPDPTGEHKKQALHPRVVPYGTLRISDLMYQVESRSGLLAGDVKGVLQTLADVMADKLEEGYIVELERIGFFSISLSSRPVMDKSEIRSESIHFRSVNFRCGKYLKKKLKTMQRLRRLTNYLSTHHYITCGDYRELTGCSKYRALQDLNQLIDEGKLTKNGYRSTRVYSFPSSVGK